jgi:protein-tyrosine phosphatase
VISISRIEPNLFVGSHPQNFVDLDRLRGQLRVTAILNLQTDEDFRRLGLKWDTMEHACHERDLVLRRWPVAEFDDDALLARVEGAVEELHELLQSGHRVYLHCTAGMERAPSVAIAYLAWRADWLLEDAYRHVIEQRACNPRIELLRRLADKRHGVAQR